MLTDNSEGETTRKKKKNKKEELKEGVSKTFHFKCRNVITQQKRFLKKDVSFFNLFLLSSGTLYMLLITKALPLF